MYEVWTELATAAARIATSRKRRSQRTADRAAEHFQNAEKKSQDGSLHGVCDRLASSLEANAIIVERLGDEILVVAGAPWKIEVDPVDKIALDWSFTTGLPPKSGMGNPFSSDWLFLPVKAGDRVVAVLGAIPRYRDRRFLLEEQPAIRNAVTSLERIYQSRISRERGEQNETGPTGT
jgi:two-component system sensor histidine kinase KdpD